MTRLYDWGIEYKDFEVVKSNVNEWYPLLPWIDEISNIKSVKAIDSGIRPKFLSNWCYGMSNATSIDLTLIDTSRCTDFRSLFNGCASIETLDLSNMDMSNMSDSRNMYAECSRLKRISVSETFRYATADDADTYPYLPVPDPNDIDGADGKWYGEATGEGYAPKDVPTGGKGTYFASNKMLPNITLRLAGADGNVIYGAIDVTNIPFDDYRIEYSTCVDKDNTVSLLQNAEIGSINGDLSDYNLAIYSRDNIFSAAALDYFKNCKIYGKVIICDNKTNRQITLYTKKITITDYDSVLAHQSGCVFLTISRFKAWRIDTLIDE